MYCTYVLYSKKFDAIYVGETSNLKNRILSHNELTTKGYTIRYRPWTIVFYETFDTRSEALNREKQLKSSRGRAYIREQITELGLLSVG